MGLSNYVDINITRHQYKTLKIAWKKRLGREKSIRKFKILKKITTFFDERTND